MLRILWICLAVWLVRGDDPAPSFPSDFKVDVLVTTWNKNNTVRSFTVAYTAKGNGQGNALYVAETSDSVQYLKVYNFEKDGYFQANTLDQSCKYANTIPDEEKVGLFPVEFEKKQDKFEYLKPDTMFHFGGEKTFVSESPAGVSLWTSNAIVQGGLCNVSFQWTTNGTTTPRCDRNGENYGACPPIPILCILDCNAHTTTFTFSGYTEELDYDIFQEPLGYYCDGKEKIPSLPALPDVFSLSAENLLPGSEDRVWYSDLWVDIENDAVATRHRQENTDVVVISDYTSGFDYEIDVKTGTCVPRATKGKPFLQESKDLLVFGEEIARDIQQSGIRGCRLSRCRVFATSAGEKVQNLYYAYDNPLDSKLVARRPAYIETRERGVIQRQRHIVAYDENVRHWDRFDLYRCFHQEDIRVLSVTIEGNTNFDKDIESMHDLREAYRKAVVNALGLSQKLRFTTFWMVPNQDRSGMTVTGFIYPAGNEEGLEDVDSDTAFSQLKSAVDQGQFLFSVNGTFGAGVLKYKGVNASLGYRSSGGGGSAQASEGYTSGNMAGLGFAMLFLGIAVAVAALYVFNRYYPKNQITKVLLRNEGS